MKLCFLSYWCILIFSCVYWTVEQAVVELKYFKIQASNLHHIFCRLVCRFSIQLFWCEWWRVDIKTTKGNWELVDKIQTLCNKLVWGRQVFVNKRLGFGYSETVSPLVIRWLLVEPMVIKLQFFHISSWNAFHFFLWMFNWLIMKWFASSKLMAMHAL